MKNVLILTCLLCYVGFFVLFKLGDPALFDPDEPRYAQSSREMIERGSLLIPYFNHEPRLNKPVVYYWIIAGSYRLLGVSELSARIGSALAGIVVVAATFFFARYTSTLQTAILSSVMLGSMPLFFVPARLAMPDMVFSLWMILSLYCFYVGWEAGASRRRTTWFTAFYAFQVIAAWTKGPVGILVPLAVAVFCLVRAKDWETLRSLKLHWGIPAVLAASLPWYLYIFFTVDRNLMLGLAGQETAGRLFGIGRGYEPLYYYLPALIGGLFPWVFLLPWAWYRRCRVLPSSRLRQFCETWFLFVFLFFSVCAAKKFQYIAMLASVSALWLGSVVSETAREQRRDVSFIVAVLVGFCLMLVAGFEGVAWISTHEPSLLKVGALGCTALLVLWGAGLLCAARGLMKATVGCLSSAMLLALIAFIMYGAPCLGERRSTRELVREHAALFEKAKAVYCASKVFNSLVFYANRPVLLNVEEDYIVEKLKSTEPCVGLISRRRAREYAEELAPFFLVEKYGRMLLTNITPHHPP